jgi:hypothetical protein
MHENLELNGKPTAQRKDSGRAPRLLFIRFFEESCFARNACAWFNPTFEGPSWQTRYDAFSRPPPEEVKRFCDVPWLVPIEIVDRDHRAAFKRQQRLGFKNNAEKSVPASSCQAAPVNFWTRLKCRAEVLVCCATSSQHSSLCLSRLPTLSSLAAAFARCSNSATSI